MKTEPPPLRRSFRSFLEKTTSQVSPGDILKVPVSHLETAREVLSIRYVLIEDEGKNKAEKKSSILICTASIQHIRH